MKDFVAIDFETANAKRSSVCSVGIVIVRNGRIENELYRLIPPPRRTTTDGSTRRSTA